MKQRNLLYVVGLLVIVSLCVLLLRQKDDTVESETSPRLEQKVVESDIIEFKENKLRVNRLRNAPKERVFHFKAAELVQPPKEAQKIEYPKFRAGGSGTRGAIRDQKGNLIWRATKENPVYSISVSPNDQRIVAGAGDGNAYIITNEGEKISDLPQFPPGNDMLGLGNWIWLDNNRLLGESGVQNFDENGKPIGCCQGHNMSESRFYVYDLRTSKMEEMQLPENLQGKVVTVGKVLKTGELQLGHEGDGFGWYQVADLGEEDR